MVVSYLRLLWTTLQRRYFLKIYLCVYLSDGFLKLLEMEVLSQKTCGPPPSCFLGLFIHIANLPSKKVIPNYSPFYLSIIQKIFILCLICARLYQHNHYQHDRHSPCPHGAYNLKEETETPQTSSQILHYKQR